MKLLDRFTTKHRFADGATMSVLHRYALRFERDGWSIDIGFEQALEPGVNRLVHESSIAEWNGTDGRKPVTSQERADVLARVKEYCLAKSMTYRVVPAGDAATK